MSDRYLKQVIVMRKDLSMPHGKLATMVAHASMKFIADKVKPVLTEDGRFIAEIEWTLEQAQWLTELDPGIEHLDQQSFAKIVVFVSSLQELVSVEGSAEARGLTIGQVFDSGYSHNPAGTFVGIAIGPHWPEAFVGITDGLKTR